MDKIVKDFLMVNGFEDFINLYSNKKIEYKDKEKIIDFLIHIKREISEHIITSISKIFFHDNDCFNILCDKIPANQKATQFTTLFSLFLRYFFDNFHIKNKVDILKFSDSFLNSYIFSESFIQYCIQFDYSELEKEKLLLFFEKNTYYFNLFKKNSIEYRSNFQAKIGFTKGLLFINSTDILNNELFYYIKNNLSQLSEEDRFFVLEYNLRKLLFPTNSYVKIKPEKNIDLFIIFMYENYFEDIKKNKNLDSRLHIYIEKEYYKLKIDNF